MRKKLAFFKHQIILNVSFSSCDLGYNYHRPAVQGEGVCLSGHASFLKYLVMVSIGVFVRSEYL